LREYSQKQHLSLGESGAKFPDDRGYPFGYFRRGVADKPTGKIVCPDPVCVTHGLAQGFLLILALDRMRSSRVLD
jgi:hypothetical protein